jgi:FkbH-like protein
MDYRFWYMSKAPFKQSFLNLYALEVFKIVRALKGKIKKCLLLDCDNTLWGGVVGEDGISGISLDRHSYPGNVYYDFHKQILRLHDRGVLIALVSKNNEEDVWEILERHSDCLIKRKHLSAWRVNWNDKAENIRSIAAELNLGIDSFVFVDDSPVECDLVRGLLPDVSVIQVPSKLYLLPGVLARDGLFDTLVLSAEDRIRSAMYQAETLRKQAEGTFTTLEEYLTTLGLEATIHLARLDDLARIAQLTQKTNQFNLTTRRYSVAQIEAFHHSSNAAVFSLNVSDRFGDSGLTGVLIALREGTVGKIDTFLLSCRVLGRNLETVFLDRCLVMLQKCWGVSKWFAEYIPSPKNGQTADFYSRVGFTVIQEDSAVKVYQSNSDQRQSLEISYISVKEGNDGLS